MKRTSSGTPTRSPSPSPTRRVRGEGEAVAPIVRTTRVSTRWQGMHHPGRPTVVVLVVGGCEGQAVTQQLDAWQLRARAVEYNYGVIEAGDPTENLSESAALLKQQVPANAKVVVLLANEDVPEENVEHAQDALSHAGLARQSLPPCLADDADTPHLPVFPSEAQLVRQTLQALDTGGAGEAVDLGAEAAFEARQRSVQLAQQRRTTDQLTAVRQQLEEEVHAMVELVQVIDDLLPDEEPPPASLPLALRQGINALQFTPHWQARASTPQAAQLTGLLLRVGRESASGGDPSLQLASGAILRCLQHDENALSAVLAAVDRCPPESSDADQLGILLGAAFAYEVGAAASAMGGDASSTPT